MNGNLPFELWIPEWLKNGKDIDKLGGWTMESSWSSGRGPGFLVSQYSLGWPCLKSSSAKNNLRFKWVVTMSMSQEWTCILNKAGGLLGYTEGDNGQEREGRCFPLLRLMSSPMDSCCMSTVCPPSIVMACFASLVNGWRRKGELPGWCDILVSRLCLATDKTHFAPSAQSLTHQYHSHRFAFQLPPHSTENSSGFGLQFSSASFLPAIEAVPFWWPWQLLLSLLHAFLGSWVLSEFRNAVCGCTNGALIMFVWDKI